MLALNTMDYKIYDAKDFPSYLPKLNQLYDDLFSGGKGFRSKLIQMVSKHLALESKAQLLLAQTIEFIHNASLLHDDLVDRSHLRRGKTTAWLRFTPEYAVLAGDYLLARVMVNLSSHGNIQLVQYTAQVISDLLEGEWLQDSLVGDFDVQLDQLDRVHNLKTGSLFKWCLRAPFIAKEIYDNQLHQTLEEMGTILGQLFQRSDDLLDFDVRNYEKKAILGDMKSGYFNSFAAFSLKNIELKKKMSLRNVQGLEDYFQVIGGEDAFKSSLSEFDSINGQLIEVYHHHLENLSSLMPKQIAQEAGELKKDLAPLTDILYFRRKP